MARYCMDCEHYVPGGVCGKNGKVTGALKEMCGTEKPVITNAEKFCRKCGRMLPIEMFNINRRNSDGRQSYCKECSKKAFKNWYDRDIKVV